MRHDVEIEVTEDGAALVVARAREVDQRSARRLRVAHNAGVRPREGPVVVDRGQRPIMETTGRAQLVNAAPPRDQAKKKTPRSKTRGG